MMIALKQRDADDRKQAKRAYGRDIDITSELIEHLTARTENHKLTEAELLTKDGRVTRHQLLRIHTSKHEPDLDTDYIQTHVKMFECTQA